MNANFSLDLLRAFVAVVDARSFTAAARLLNSTQSTVSQKILRLEEAAGQQLLDRGRRGVQLTDCGEQLLGYARRLLALHDEAVGAMSGAAASMALRLGLAEDFASRLVTPALAQFMREHPNIRLEVTSGLSRDLQRGFNMGEFDLVMVKQRRGETAGVMHWPEPLCWLESAAYPMTGADSLPLVAFSPNGLYRNDMTNALDKVGRRWHLAYTSSSLASIQTAVAEGLGVSLLPRRVALPSHRIAPWANQLPQIEAMEIVIHHMSDASQHIRHIAATLAATVDA